MIRLKIYLNPLENSCSKVISILITGNIFFMSPLLLHSNTNQYNINGLICTYTEMFRIQTCCNHILSAAEGFRVGGGGGQEATCADQGIFVSFIWSSAYFTV